MIFSCYCGCKLTEMLVFLVDKKAYMKNPFPNMPVFKLPLSPPLNNLKSTTFVLIKISVLFVLNLKLLIHVVCANV